MENVSFAKICVEVDVNGPFPNSIAIRPEPGSDSILMVNVEYSWKPTRCGNCQQTGHDVAKCRAKIACLLPHSSKSGPPAPGSSVQTSPPDQLPAVLDSCVVNDPLSPPGPPCIPDSLCEASSKISMVTSKLKESGMETSGNPAIICRVKGCDVSQLGPECDPDSVPLNISRDLTGVDLGLDFLLNADSPISDSENSEISVGAESVPVIPRTASCPALLQLSTECNAPISCLPIGPSFAEILCRGIDADPPGLLVGGMECWPISEVERFAALGLVGAPAAVPKLDSALLPPVSEQACGPVADPLDLEVDLDTPPSISRIIKKYSLDTSYQLGHGLSSPIGLSAASPMDSHLDTPELSLIAAPSQKDSWQSVKSRRKRKSASKGNRN